MRRWIHYTHGGMASFGAFHCINDAGHGGEGDQILVVWNSILVDLMLLVGLFWQTITISTWKSIEFLKRPESFIFSSFAALLFQKKSKQVRLKCHKDLQDKLHEKTLPPPKKKKTPNSLHVRDTFAPATAKGMFQTIALCVIIGSNQSVKGLKYGMHCEAFPRHAGDNQK